MNQCDGCRAKYPVDKWGIHQVPYPSGPMVCEKEKYRGKKEESETYSEEENVKGCCKGEKGACSSGSCSCGKR